MAGKKKSYYKSAAPEAEELEERKPMVVMKPYVDTLTKETHRDDVNVDKLPAKVLVTFRGDPLGNKSNRYLGKSGQRYDFNGGVPIEITNDTDRVWFVLKAKKNPETWEVKY